MSNGRLVERPRSMLTADQVPRVAPLITELTALYWMGGSVNELRISRCSTCDLYVHPPAPVCRRCHGLQFGFVPVSGRAIVASFSVNYHHWADGFELPYVVALAQLDEQDDLLLVTNIVGCGIEVVEIGMPIEVEFLALDDAWLPLFHPREVP